MMKHIPVSEPNIGEREKELVMDALKKGEISGTHGEYIKKFEEGFSNYVDCGHGIATSNGTTALHLALVSLGIGRGDEVLVSTLTNMAPCFAVLFFLANSLPLFFFFQKRWIHMPWILLNINRHRHCSTKENPEAGSHIGKG